MKKAKQQPAITQIAYESFARRGRTDIVITKDSAISIGKNSRKYIMMSPAKWNELTASLKLVKLASIPTWVSPTKAREYDGASHSKISVSTKTTTYESQYFDGGKPMKQLQALYDAIDKLRVSIEEEGKES